MPSWQRISVRSNARVIQTKSPVCAGVYGTNVLVPRLKQLPENAVGMETVRQKLLAQHNLLIQRITGQRNPLFPPAVPTRCSTPFPFCYHKSLPDF